MRSSLDRLRILQDETFRLTNETLASFRIVFFFFAVAVRTPSSLMWAADYPDWLRNPPPGLPSLIGVPPVPLLVTIQVAAVTFAALGLVGLHTRVAAIGYSIAMVVHHSIEFGFGKIDHDLLWLVLPLVLASSGWDQAYSLDATRRSATGRRDWLLRNSRAVAILYTVLAVAFSTAAVAKLRIWLDPTVSTAADFVRYYQATQPDTAILAGASLRLPPVLWEAADLATIGIEMAPLALLFVPHGARRVAFPLALFHLSVLLTMGIDFGPFLIVYIPLAAHPMAGDRFAHTASRLSPRQWLAVALAACSAWKWGVAPAIESLGGEGSLAYVPELLMFAITAYLLVLFSVAPRSTTGMSPERRETDTASSGIGR